MHRLGTSRAPRMFQLHCKDPTLPRQGNQFNGTMSQSEIVPITNPESCSIHTPRPLRLSTRPLLHSSSPSVFKTCKRLTNRSGFWSAVGGLGGLGVRRPWYTSSPSQFSPLLTSVLLCYLLVSLSNEALAFDAASRLEATLPRRSAEARMGKRWGDNGTATENASDCPRACSWKTPKPPATPMHRDDAEEPSCITNVPSLKPGVVRLYMWGRQGLDTPSR